MDFQKLTPTFIYSYIVDAMRVIVCGKCYGSRREWWSIILWLGIVEWNKILILHICIGSHIPDLTVRTVLQVL